MFAYRITLLCTALLVALPCLSQADGTSTIDSSRCTVKWDAASLNSPCAAPVLCPGEDATSRIQLTLYDQFGLVKVGVGATQIQAEGACPLAAGTPCTQAFTVYADGPTNGYGQTTITIQGAGTHCERLGVSARGIQLTPVVFGSYDVTGDLRVDISDLGLLASSFNTGQGDAGFSPALDFSCDGRVDVSDLGSFATHYAHTCSP